MDSSKISDTSGHRDRVRQKFLATGGDDFADYEMLELLLILAIPRRDVKPLAKELLRKLGSFAEVISAPADKLAETKWIKQSTITLFQAIMASTKRICRQKLSEIDTPVIFNTDILIDYCRATMAYNEVEELRVIYLDAGLKVVATELLQKGSLTKISVEPRDIIIKALANKAPSIILVHNHPSDNSHPSPNDIKLTQRIEKACELMGIKLQEHIIIGKSDYFSFVENNLVNVKN